MEASFEVSSFDGTHTATIHAPRTLVDGETVRAVSSALDLPGVTHVRLMPDCHVGHGCVVGFTAQLTPKWWQDGLAPHLIGSDIGCGVAAVPLPHSVHLDKARRQERWEAAIVRAVPRGAALQPAFDDDEAITDDTVQQYLAPACAEAQAIADALAARLPPALAATKPTYTAAWLRDTLCARVGATFVDDVLRSLGSLGSGNHFVEVDELAEVGDHAALKVAEEQRKVDMFAALQEWWRSGAIRRPRVKFTARAGMDRVQAAYKAACDKLGVPATLAPFAASVVEGAEGSNDIDNVDATADTLGLPPHLLVAHSGSRHLGHCIAVHYGAIATATGSKLVGKDAVAYAFDVIAATALAKMNRALILRAVLREVGIDFSMAGVIDNAHNVIDWTTSIIRKGAAPAPAGAPVLVALNMRDGVLLCTGRGNPEWNDSTAHGCGRSLPRALASRKVTMDAFKRAMRDVVTTSVRAETLDEAPQAYKDKDDVQVALAPSVHVRARYKAVVNVKGW